MGFANELQIDSEHCHAICEEIGARLRVMLSRDPSPLPVRLQMLMDRLAEQDGMIPSPSIAPSMDDMVWPAEASENGPELARVA